MLTTYDELIKNHYQKIAYQEGLSPSSTMADKIIREKETDYIIQFVDAVYQFHQQQGKEKPLCIMDVGCGNGYTLSVLLKHYPQHHFIGIELVDELRELAKSRFSEVDPITIFKGDIRNPEFIKNYQPDIIICQRVLINLLSLEDQKKSLQNIINHTSSGCCFLFLESFQSPLQNLNEARAEFNLNPIQAAHHNLYLPDHFFECAALKSFPLNSLLPPSNFLSTHFFISRVLHAAVNDEKLFKRNSHFVFFLSQAITSIIGDYAPLKANAFYYE